MPQTVYLLTSDAYTNGGPSSISGYSIADKNKSMFFSYFQDKGVELYNDNTNLDSKRSSQRPGQITDYQEFKKACINAKKNVPEGKSRAVLVAQVLSTADLNNLTAKDILYVNSAYLVADDGLPLPIFLDSKRNPYKQAYNQDDPYQPLMGMLQKYCKSDFTSKLFKRKNREKGLALMEIIKELQKAEKQEKGDDLSALLTVGPESKEILTADPEERGRERSSLLDILKAELIGINPDGDYSKCIKAMIEYEASRLENEAALKVRLRDPAANAKGKTQSGP